jgi:hypothetical protein
MSGQRPEDWSQRRIVLLRRSNGSRVLNTARELPGYDGRGASKALLLASERLRDQRGMRALRLNKMALEQVEREQARESEAA